MAEIRKVAIRVEGEHVQVINDGRLTWEMPWQSALEMGQALQRAARKGEEWSKRDQLIFDQGLLHRMGIRLGIISDPGLKAEALKVAQRNDILRRNIPNRIRSDAANVGTPMVIRNQEVSHGRKH